MRKDIVYNLTIMLFKIFLKDTLSVVQVLEISGT